MSISTFLNDWKSNSKQHDFKKYVRVYGNLEVSLYQSARKNNTIRLGSLKSTKPKKGEATKFIKWLAKQADKHQFDVTLCAHPFGWDGEDLPGKDKLKLWVEKYGFSVREEYPEEWGYEMIRCAENTRTKKNKKN